MTQQLIPTIHVVEESLPAAWERSITETWKHGMRIPTQFDHPEDPNSRDVSALIVVKDPFAEPRFHRCFPGGFYDLEKYVAEVLDGVDDTARAEIGCYTYHERLNFYRTGVASGIYYGQRMVKQLSAVLDNLMECQFTRRAQATTWVPDEDCDSTEPPCLQRLWFRVIEDEKQNPQLCMSVDFRSNDGFKAAYMNMYALTWLQARMAVLLSDRMGYEVGVGQYTHYANSYHLYGSYFSEIESFLLDVDGRRTWEDRTMTTAEAWKYGWKEDQDAVKAKYGLPGLWPFKGLDTW